MASDPEPETSAASEASEFFADAGPEFTPDSSPEIPTPELLEDQQLPEPEGWTADGVAEFLRSIQAPAFNAGLNPLLGVSKVDWTHREARLVAVAPAIAREWNKIPRIRALAGATDRGLILSYLLLEYMGPRAFQVIGERREIREAREAEQAAEDVRSSAFTNAYGPDPTVVDEDRPPPPPVPPTRR